MGSLVRAVGVCAFSVPPVFHSASGFMHPVLFHHLWREGHQLWGNISGLEPGGAFILGLGFLISGSLLLWTSVFLSLEQPVFVTSH